MDLILQLDINVVMSINFRKFMFFLNIFELSFYQVENEWKYNVIPIEVS